MLSFMEQMLGGIGLVLNSSPLISVLLLGVAHACGTRGALFSLRHH